MPSTNAMLLTRDPASYSVTKEREIHIVDQDIFACKQLSFIFNTAGFHTSYATDWRRDLTDSSDICAVLINFDLPTIPGLSALRQVRLQMPGVAAFMLANSPDVDSAVLAMKAGAINVFQKPVDPELLTEDVRQALRRNSHVGAGSDDRRKSEVRRFSELTSREHEVLQLIVNGRSNKEAGRALGISPRTIEVHRAKVMEKLFASNTADLMRIVLTS